MVDVSEPTSPPTLHTYHISLEVGGSQGFAYFAIARKHPSMSFVVQDAEPVVAAAQGSVLMT